MSGSVRRLIRNMRKMERLQTLIGRAMTAYGDDGVPDPARAVMDPLREALAIVIELRGPGPLPPKEG